MSKSLGERIREEREKRHWSQSDLGRKSNLSNEYISKIELSKATNVGIETIEAIANALEVHPSQILFGVAEKDLLKYVADTRLKIKKDEEKPQRPENALDAPEYEPYDIPVIGLTKAGRAGFFDDMGYPVGEGFRKIHRPYFVRDPHAYALQVDGDSMAPRIMKGELVLVAPSHEVRNGDLVIAKTREGEVMLKEVKFQDGLVILSSRNPNYEPIALKKRDLEFLHRVVMIKT